MSYIFGLGNWKIQTSTGGTLDYTQFTKSTLREKASFEEKIVKRYSINASLQSSNRGFYYSAELEFWDLTKAEYDLLTPLQGTTVTIYPDSTNFTNGFPVFVKQYLYAKNQFNGNIRVVLELQGQEPTDYGLGLYCNNTLIYCNSTDYYCNGSAV